VDSTDIQGRLSMAKHSLLAKICENRESFPPRMIWRKLYITYIYTCKTALYMVTIIKYKPSHLQYKIKLKISDFKKGEWLIPIMNHYRGSWYVQELKQIFKLFLFIRVFEYYNRVFRCITIIVNWYFWSNSDIIIIIL